MPNSNNYPAVITSDLTATIASSASLSGVVDLSGTTVVAIVMPSSWDAADISLQASVDGTNFFDVYDQYGNEVNIPADADNFITLSPAAFASIQFMKIRSGSSASAVVQSASRDITIVTRFV